MQVSIFNTYANEIVSLFSNNNFTGHSKVIEIYKLFCKKWHKCYVRAQRVITKTIMITQLNVTRK